jgi:putative hemolysin
MVFDNRSGKVIATTRLLLEEDAIHAGLFYSETEFDLHQVLKQPGYFMEVGRTCIHPDFRKGAVLAVLWQGIATVIYENNIDYLIGCASISLHGGDAYVNSVINHLRKHHYSDDDLRVVPRIPLKTSHEVVLDDVVVPTLLKGYLNQGALICGEPHWDAEFHVADVFVLLPTKNLADRYQRHFAQRD